MAQYRFNPPPNWPPLPHAHWRPPRDWTPPREWGPPPPGWQLWTPVPRSIFAHPIVIVGYVVAGIASLVIIGSLGDNSGAGSALTEPTSSSTSSAEEPTTPTDEATDESTDEPTDEPTATASPDGTFSGSCDYELFPYKVTGEVDVENAGNVGIVADVRISWPQLGYKPIKMVKRVRVAYGHTRTVRFHRPVTATEIDRLQSWQVNHGFDDGCKYHSTIVNTFGSVH